LLSSASGGVGLDDDVVVEVRDECAEALRDLREPCGEPCRRERVRDVERLPLERAVELAEQRRKVLPRDADRALEDPRAAGLRRPRGRPLP
jgi:hypothetical protein